MAKTIVAVDPGSNKLGIALFEDETLVGLMTQWIKGDTPDARRINAAHVVEDFIAANQPDVFISEEPLLMGRNNNGMQRLLGMFEFIIRNINWVHPMTVKKYMGSGSLDKLDVALAAGSLLKTESERELVAKAIEAELWDSTDAVAIGLTWMIKQKEKSDATSQGKK